MDSPCIKQTVCKVLNIFQCGKYLVAYVLKLPVVIKTFVLCIFQWPFYTGFTVFRFLRFVLICNDCGVLMRVAKVCEW